MDRARCARSPRPASATPALRAACCPSRISAGLREILEAGVLPEEGQPDRADRAVALLAYDDLGHTLVLRFLVVNLVAIDEQDHVSVLLDRAGLAQVRHDRSLVRALLEAAVEDRKSTRLNSSHMSISYAVFCLKKKKNKQQDNHMIEENKRQQPTSMIVTQALGDTSRPTPLK